MPYAPVREPIRRTRGRVPRASDNNSTATSWPRRGRLCARKRTAKPMRSAGNRTVILFKRQLIVAAVNLYRFVDAVCGELTPENSLGRFEVEKQVIVITTRNLIDSHSTTAVSTSSEHRSETPGGRVEEGRIDKIDQMCIWFFFTFPYTFFLVITRLLVYYTNSLVLVLCFDYTLSFKNYISVCGNSLQIRRFPLGINTRTESRWKGSFRTDLTAYSRAR